MAISDITKPMALDETLQATNGKMDSVITKLQGIIDALGLDTSVYKPKGNITCAALVPALLIDDNLGNVYNVTDNGTTTSDFVEGAGKPIHVGDNVAIVDIGTGGQSEYKFDLLAGMVDLTNYVQKSATPGLLKNDGTVDTKDYAEKVAGATNGNLAGLNASGNLTDSGWNGAKDTTSISGNPISISGLKSNQLAINPIITFEPIQAGSGTPSPSNIRAISGYDKIEVLSCGKNLFDADILLQASGWSKSNGVYSGPTNTPYGIWSLAKGGFPNLKFKPNTQYTLSLIGHVSEQNKWFAFEFEYSDGTTKRQTFGQTTDGTIRMISDSGKTVTKLGTIYGDNATCYMHDIQLEEGSSATTYEAPNKTTDLSESLGQTVYGGTLDVRTGKAVVDTGFYTIDDSASISIWGSPQNPWLGFTTPLPANARSGRILVVGDYVQSIDGNVTSWNAYGVNGFLYVTFDGSVVGGRTSTDIKNYLSSHPLHICYPLANPTEIQLTPHEISLLKDYAYVSTNGTSISLDYHNGELASLSDVAQVGETVNELGKSLTHVRLNVNWGNVASGTTYSYNLTSTIPAVTVDALRAISIMCAKGASNQDAQGIYNYRMSSSGTDIVLQYHCALTQNSAISVVDVLYQS